MKKLSLFVLLFSAMTSLMIAQEKMDKKMDKKMEMKEVTISGEIIDVKCYLGGMMGGKGEEHEECAINCIKGGLPVGILEDKTENVYTAVPKKGMKGANDELVDYAAKKVKLTGMIMEKGGQKLFVYSKVEGVK